MHRLKKKIQNGKNLMQATYSTVHLEYIMNSQNSTIRNETVQLQHGQK